MVCVAFIWGADTGPFVRAQRLCTVQAGTAQGACQHSRKGGKFGQHGFKTVCIRLWPFITQRTLNPAEEPMKD
jgi:hypothetical protein